MTIVDCPAGKCTEIVWPCKDNRPLEQRRHVLLASVTILGRSEGQHEITLVTQGET